jgi:fumarylacetoacetate (FAA) hydrolase
MRLVTVRDRSGAVRVGELLGERVRVLRAASLQDWLAEEGRDPAGEELDAHELQILAPVPVPPSVRDFYSFERHVAAGWRRRGGEIPEHWYAAPAFYFSNPASILGPGEPVRRPPQSRMLDFELEIAAVIGAASELAGFTLMNDWSARDVQAREVTVGLGPHKAKDFGTSIGPWLVTPDELPYRDGRLDLEAAAFVNGREVARGSAAEQHFSWPEIVAAAASGTRLRPGDVLGSGTLAGGCLLELGPRDLGGDGRERWLEPGDVVTLAAEGLGELENPVVE